MPEPETSHFWNAMASAAERGNLYLAPGVAQECDRVCVEYLTKLRAHKSDAGTIAIAPQNPRR
ncbi:hypothetical protein [Rhodococcoides yunnanense]|uniref:hypothetical protein n=1 Tax=Rhodococcoides yunnanense TaxID=278209 RepID=UPI001114D80E|nr:hypothetical protein [Rhodococcus yunnanensis]